MGLHKSTSSSLRTMIAIRRQSRRGKSALIRDTPPAAAEQAIYDPALPGARSLVGRVAAHGLADEHGDRHYLIIDATDGRSYYVAIGRGVKFDNLLVTGNVPSAVPEPATWAMMIMGFGLAGTAIRKRRRSLAFG